MVPSCSLLPVLAMASMMSVSPKITLCRLVIVLRNLVERSQYQLTQHTCGGHSHVPWDIITC